MDVDIVIIEMLARDLCNNYINMNKECSVLAPFNREIFYAIDKRMRCRGNNSMEVYEHVRVPDYHVQITVMFWVVHVHVCLCGVLFDFSNFQIVGGIL